MSVCKACERPLKVDEIALYRRLIYRDTEESDCLCLSCLSKKLGVSEKDLKDKIEHFRSIGCTLFI